jgi:hypothetical protein
MLSPALSPETALPGTLPAAASRNRAVAPFPCTLRVCAGQLPSEPLSGPVGASKTSPIREGRTCHQRPKCSRERPARRPPYGYTPQEIIFTKLAHAADGRATYGVEIPPLRVRYGAAGVPLRAAGVGALKNSSRAGLSPDRTHTRLVHTDKRLRAAPPLALAWMGAGRSQGHARHRDHHRAYEGSTEQPQRPPS